MALPRYKGTILVKDKHLNLDFTLLGGQSFRWKRNQFEHNAWKGVARNTFWYISQSSDSIHFEAYPETEEFRYNNSIQKLDEEYFKQILCDYLRLDIDLGRYVEEWKMSHDHFKNVEAKIKAVRLLNQEPLENIISFICSQNNHIKRISTMVNWLCSTYGSKIGRFDGKDEYTFPSLKSLVANKNQLEPELRKAKFGYRAKFISQVIHEIDSSDGSNWFSELKRIPYEKARSMLLSLPGIGPKVADCICLMSLGHFQAVPIDTHIFKVAKTSYLPSLLKTKSVTPKVYKEIADHFRNVYGELAGWAQTVLFCSELKQLETFITDENHIQRKKIKR